MKKILIIFCCFLLVGCMSKEEKAQGKAYEKQGEKNAITYIKNKYGFNPEINAVEVLKYSNTYGLSSYYTGEVCVEMSYHGKDFLVYIRGDEITSEGVDDYQKQEIEDAFVNYAEEMLGKRPHSYEFYYTDHTDIDVKKPVGFVNEYFDGTNLMSILDNKHNTITLNYYEYDFSKYKDSEILLKNYDINIYNFRDKESLESAKYITSVENDPYTCALVMSEMLINDSYYDFNLQKYDDFYYIVFGGSIDSIYECQGNLSNDNSLKPLSKEYCINGEYEKIFIYYPRKFGDGHYTIRMSYIDDYGKIQKDSNNLGVYEKDDNEYLYYKKNRKIESFVVA